MILITGATGHLGGHVLENLLKKTDASNIAVLVRDENKAADLKAKGVEIRVGNFNDAASLANAFNGIDKMLLISSSDLEDRLGQHKNVIDAAKNASVRIGFMAPVLCDSLLATTWTFTLPADDVSQV